MCNRAYSFKLQAIIMLKCDAFILSAALAAVLPYSVYLIDQTDQLKEL